MSLAVAAGTPATVRSPRPTLTIDPTLAPKPSGAPSFVIPTILITPPDAPPQYSTAVPEQRYEKSVLFVPVKTEELGWDEHGLYWNGTYAYPVHEIYDKEGHPIGRRRKGPSGYRFEEYYDNKKLRRANVAAALHGEDAVEEAIVRLDEPAPARIEKVTRAADDVLEGDVAKAQEEQGDEDEDEDEMASPASPTLSVTSSEMTEDGSSVGDDTSSIWSHNDATSDDDDDDDDEEEEESNCTSPGIMSPPLVDGDHEAGFQAEALSKKLSNLSATTPDKVALKTSWLRLGNLPSSASSFSDAAAASRSQSLPTTRASSSRAVGLSHTHRASSTLVADAGNFGGYRGQRRRSHPDDRSGYTSIIQDLTTSPFASSAAKISNSPPFRSATLPRSHSRTGYAQSRDAATAGAGSILRAPPAFVTTSSSGGSVRGRHSSTSTASSASRVGHSRAGASKASSRSRSDLDFSAGWNFESHSAALSNHWDDSFANHY